MSSTDVGKESVDVAPQLAYPKWAIVLYTAILLAAVYVVGYVALGATGKPKGLWFGLYTLFLAAHLLGALMSLIKIKDVSLPPLLGMLLAGLILRSIPVVNAHTVMSIPSSINELCRNTGLFVIMLRAGLGVDLHALKRRLGHVLALGFVPMTIEAIVVAVLGRFMLNMPWVWSLMLGFVLAAVSPAVVVPTMLHLQEERLGTNKDVPTLVMAASSIDDVLAVAAYGMCFSFTFPVPGQSAILNGFKGPLELVVGVLSGLVAGCVLAAVSSYDPISCLPHYLRMMLCCCKRPAPPSPSVSSLSGTTISELKPHPPHLMFVPRVHKVVVCVMVCFCGAMIMFGYKKLDLTSAGTLAIMVYGGTLQFWWHHPHYPNPGGSIPAEVTVSKENMEFCKGLTKSFWQYIAMPLLFAMIGISVDLGKINGSRAAIGAKALDKARSIVPPNPNHLLWGEDILVTSVFSILITATIGSILLNVLAPLMLEKEADMVGAPCVDQAISLELVECTEIVTKDDGKEEEEDSSVRHRIPKSPL
eukprot:Platyproteum_vivax@DN7383_c0_g1_i2.p1